MGYYYCDFVISISWCVFKLVLMDISGKEFQKFFEQRNNHVAFQDDYLEAND